MRQIILFLAFGLLLNAQEPAAKLIELDKTPSSQILEDEGNVVRIKGFVVATRTNATGINFLDFKDTDFVCVTFTRNVSAFPDGPPAEVYKEKMIEITGEIQKYRGIPQIRLETPDQIKILNTPPPPEPVVEPAPEEKTEPEGVKTDEAKPETPELPKASLDRVLEVIDGVEALDWRKYFPE